MGEMIKDPLMKIKKPLLVILVIGMVPVLVLLIGLVVSHKGVEKIADNFNYPQTDNAFLDPEGSKSKVLEFFNLAGKDIGVINLFKDQTLDQLRYDNYYSTNLTVALESISFIKLESIEPFEADSWTAQDHLYLTSYQLTLTDNTYSFLGTNGTNEKLFLLVKEGNDANNGNEGSTANDGDGWKISDIMDVPSF